MEEEGVGEKQMVTSRARRREEKAGEGLAERGQKQGERVSFCDCRSQCEGRGRRRWRRNVHWGGREGRKNGPFCSATTALLGNMRFSPRQPSSLAMGKLALFLPRPPPPSTYSSPTSQERPFLRFFLSQSHPSYVHDTKCKHMWIGRATKKRRILVPFPLLG